MVTGKIGLFGGAGSGKSEVAKILKNKYHAVVIEADKVAHDLYDKYEPGYKSVVSLLGNVILDASFNIDRKVLGNILYNDEKLLNEVNAVIHPLVYERTRQLINEYDIADEKHLVVYEAAIIPRKEELNLDASIYVYSPENVRAERLMFYRGYSDERINSIFSLQASEEEFRDYCDYVIINTDNFDRLEDETDAAFNYCQRKQR